MAGAVALTGMAGAAVVLLLQAAAARGGEADAGVAIGAGIGVAAMHFEFEEFDAQDRRLVKESGWLPGVSANFDVRRRRASLSVDLNYFGGDVDYDGQTSSAVPLNSSTDQRMLDASFSAAYRLPLQIPPRVLVHAGGAYRHWSRDIQSVGRVSGLDETYRWWRAEAGARLRWPSANGSWLLDARLTRTLDPQVEVDFGGAFDDVNLDLGERWGWSAAAGWLQPVAARLAAHLSLFYQHWELGSSAVETLSSNGVPAGSVFQPRSESRNYGVTLSLQRDW